MNEVFEFIKTETTNWKTTRVPLTNSKDWNMAEHIERCMNVSNGWFHQGKNDGLRPYDDIVTPIIDVAFRLEGFDVKDIVPFVDDIEQNHKSFLIKKRHPQWARENEIDTFIDEVVESSIIYDLVLVKNVNNARPEVIKLQNIAFCDQTDVLSGPLCFKHQYSVSDILEYKGKWIDEKIDEVIVMAKASKTVSTSNDQEVKTPGKYIECYELHGTFPESWLREDGDPDKYVDQMHIVNYYTSSDGNKNGICLYKGKSKKLSDKFKALKIDQVRSHGRACGKSIVERLFEPQVWNNYSGIKIKKMLDSAVNLLQTDSEEFGNKKISDLKENTVIKHEPGRPITRVDMQIQNLTGLQNYKIDQQNSAQKLGSATDGQLGKNPTSGTPFALENLVVQQGEGIHTYRQGKIATFFADVLYRDWITHFLIKDLNSGVRFSEELSLDELQEVVEKISDNKINERFKEMMLKKGQPLSEEEKTSMKDIFKQTFLKKGNRAFMETIKNELQDVPVKVFVNVAGKQRYMAQNADKLTKVIGFVIQNSQAFASIPGLGKAVNELLEESGMSAIDFSQITSPPKIPEAQPIKSPLQANNLQVNQ